MMIGTTRQHLRVSESEICVLNTIARVDLAWYSHQNELWKYDYKCLRHVDKQSNNAD